MYEGRKAKLKRFPNEVYRNEALIELDKIIAKLSNLEHLKYKKNRLATLIN